MSFFLHRAIELSLKFWERLVKIIGDFELAFQFPNLELARLR
ncbi:MAG: hypothetical protein JWM99_1604 [Verrucomicrobiales bacterium]|nr:hypothetical protein [Verrucomicrobiales bacterium]